MTDVIFSLDTEDFTSNRSADAVYREAEVFREEGIRAGFCIVGLLAEQLENWGRRDVLDALKHHDIGTHTYGHSLHPTINEYTDIESYTDAHAEFIRQETKAVNMIKHATGRYPIFSCPPGNQKTYVGMYGFSDLDIPIYADTYCDTADGEGAFYCNIYQAQYTFSLESFFQNNSEEFMLEKLNELSEYKRVIIFTHPNAAVFNSTWDIENYCKKNLCEFGQWKEPPRKSEEETERFYESIRNFVKLVKADKRFNITSYSELASTLSKEKKRIVRKIDIPYLDDALSKEFYAVRKPISLSLSDIFLACHTFLNGNDEHICGKVYGFLDTPYAISEPVTVTATDVIATAKAMDVSAFLPEKIMVGDVFLGPADYMRAALKVLQGEALVTVAPDTQLPSLEALPKTNNCNFKTWIIQSDDFEDNYLSKRLKLQSWTLRFLDKENLL